MSGEIDDDLIGIDAATLQTWLTQAQTALQTLLTGGQAVTVTYAAGDAHRSVQFTRADADRLRARISSLISALQALGAINPPRHRRRAVRPNF